MIVRLLTEHHLEFLSFKGGCTGSSESTLVKNATLLEITCHGSFRISDRGAHVLLNSLNELGERNENNKANKKICMLQPHTFTGAMICDIHLYFTLQELFDKSWNRKS